MDYSILINLLRAKQIVTPLEKDILDTWNELQKTPFDMDSSQRQILWEKRSSCLSKYSIHCFQIIYLHSPANKSSTQSILLR